MTANNGSGVIRIGRKGVKKFAFGDDGEPFEVDVVVAFQEWVGIDDQFRERTDDRTILTADMPEYHRAAVDFVHRLMSEGNGKPTTAESLDFIARLREQYDEVAAFFVPKLREEPGSPGTSLEDLETELQFSVEEN